MSTKLTTAPKAVLAGTHQLIAPLPVDSVLFRTPVVLGASVGGYQGRDGLAAALQNSALTVPAVSDTAGFIGTIAADDFPWDDTARTTHNIPYPTVPAAYGGAIAFEDLLVVDCVTMDLTAAVTPNTPGGWGSRGSFHNGVAWVPKVTRFFKMAAGGETGTFAITTSSSVRMYAYIRVIRGVDPSNYFDIVAPTVTYGSGLQSPNPGAASAVVTAGSLMEVAVHGNVYPGGNPEYESSDFSPGFAPVFDNTHLARWSAAGEKVMASVGATDDPAPLGIVCDNFAALSDVYRVKKQASATLVLVVTPEDETASGSIGTAPVIPARNEKQTIISNLTSGTFTITFSGQTTAAIAFNASAATIKTALENLSNIGAGDINATGGPLGTNQVVIEFVNAMAGADQPAMTTSTGSVTIRQDQTGAPAITFNNSGNSNVPVTAPVDDYVPQIYYWTVTPTGAWPAGRPVNITVSDHANNHSWAAALLAVRDLFPSGPTQTYGSGVSDNSEQVAIFGTVTPATPGSLVLASFAKALTYAGWHPLGGPVPDISHPARYKQVAHAEADAMTLDLFVSSPAASSAERLSSVTWSGLENYADHLVSLRPLVSAGTTTAEDVLAAQHSLSWLELANPMSELYEVFELDLSDIPTGAALTSASISFAHSSDVLNPLRVTLVGINDDGTFVTALERRPGGYSTQNVNTVEQVQTGEWFEFSDGSVISDYTRLGVLVFSTARPPGLTTHKLYWVTAEVTYEAGGPIVANVQGVNAPGDEITWDYSSAAGLPQSHSRVLVVQGADWDLDVQFADYFFTDFPTVGAGATVLSSGTYELYDGTGNAGFGRRRPSAIAVVADGTASGGTKLQITASNGTGGDAGQLVSGGLKIKLPITYGQIEFRAKGSGDANNFVSPVVLMWPTADASRFPDIDGGVWPAGGEINVWENFANRDDLNPAESHVHRLKPGAVPVFDAADDDKLDFTWTGVAGTGWHKYVLNWLPTGLYLSIDDGAFVALTEDPNWVPDWPMELCIQLDAWANGTLGASRTMDVDYVVLRKLAVEVPAANPLAPAFGEIIADSGKLPGATRRSHTFVDQPIGSGARTALVRAWARLPNGVEVTSRWGIDESFDTTGTPPATGVQTAVPVFNPLTSGVELTLITPPGVSRAWAVRSIDQGASWTLVGPWDVGADTTVKVVDYDAPLGQMVRYEVAFDNGPMTETSAPTGLGTGTGGWLVQGGRIIRPEGGEIAVAGLNGGVAIGTGASFSIASDVSIGWAYDGYPGASFKRYSDVWAESPQLVNGNEAFPGGTISPGRYWNHAILDDASAPAPDGIAPATNSGTIVTLPDRVYALTGVRSQDAIDFGIPQPESPWEVGIFRVNAHLVNGANTWGSAPTLTAVDTVPQYVARVQELVDLGLVVAIEDHDMTGTDPVMPAGLVANPSLALGSIPAGPVQDACRLYDALAAAFPGDTHNVWIGLPNEAYTIGRNTNLTNNATLTQQYDDFVVTFVRRIRAAGFTGIITVPLGRWAGELGPLSRGDYDTLIATLESHGVAYNIVWEVHFYGANYPVGVGAAAVDYTWAAADAEFQACRNQGKALWVAEYGRPTPTPDPGNIPEYRTINAVEIMARDTFGPPLATKYPHLCASWWSTADNTFNVHYALTKGAVNELDENAGDPNVTGAPNSGVFPWWKVTTQEMADKWLTSGGRAHRSVAHALAGMASSVGDVSTVSTSWWLRVPSAPSMNTPITVIETQDTRGFNSVVAEDVEHAVVVSSPPLSRVLKLTVRVHSEAERNRVDAILDSGLTFEVVNILGRSWKVRLAGDITEQLLRWAPLPTEVTNLRDAHELTFTAVEVKV